MSKEKMHYTCIACITIDSIKRIEKKNYPEVYLGECNYRKKKIQMSRFLTTELESESESYLQSKLDTELTTKLESGSDSE